MIPAIKSEFRKICSVRSTYFIVLGAYALLLFMSLWGEGFKSGPFDATGPAKALFLAGSIVQHATMLSIFGAIIALLFITHEYRYNTIIYTLTASNSRNKVISSKIIAILLAIGLFAAFGILIGFVGMIVGLHLSGHSLPHQDLSILTYVGKVLFYCEAYALVALMFGFLLRNQIAAFVVLFVVPNTVENLLSLIIKQHTVYLPFTALQQVITPSAQAIPRTGTLSPMKAVGVFSIYFVIGWIVTWYLFLKRDAN